MQSNVPLSSITDESRLAQILKKAALTDGVELKKATNLGELIPSLRAVLKPKLKEGCMCFQLWDGATIHSKVECIIYVCYDE